MNNRRKLVMALGVAAMAAPFASLAQQHGKVWRVGFLASRHVDFLDSDSCYGPFRQGMHELGYVDGKNLVIEWRSAEGSNDRLPALATRLRTASRNCEQSSVNVLRLCNPHTRGRDLR